MRLRHPFWIFSNRSIRMLATIIAMADDISIIPYDKDGENWVQISLGVRDRWKSWHFEE